MNRRGYKSSIPATAKAVIEKCCGGCDDQCTAYYIGSEKVGCRFWHDNGEVELEYGLRAGQKHGNELWFYPNGELLSVEPYRNGRIHGICKQWGEDGRLLVTYRMVDGVGLDLWCDTRTGRLSEDTYFPGVGELGHQREWNNDEKTVWEEGFWLSGKGWHGIQRKWNQKTGRLRRGYPQYFVCGEKITKRQYIQACKTDSSLPPYRLEDDAPFRQLPAEYLAQRKRDSTPSAKKRM